MSDSRPAPTRAEPLKVLITGAYSTGKSTLAAAIRIALEHMGVATAVVGEAARACPLPLNREQTVLSSCWILAEVIRQEAEACSRSTQVLLCDRGVPDVVAHTLAVGDTGDVVQRERAAFDAIAKAWVMTYDLVFLSTVDPVLPIAVDDLRVDEKQYQMEMAEKAHEALAFLGVQASELPLVLEPRVRLIVERTMARLSEEHDW